MEYILADNALSSQYYLTSTNAVRTEEEEEEEVLSRELVAKNRSQKEKGWLLDRTMLAMHAMAKDKFVYVL